MSKLLLNGITYDYDEPPDVITVYRPYHVRYAMTERYATIDRANSTKVYFTTLQVNK